MRYLWPTLYIKNEEKLAQKLNKICDTFGKECEFFKLALVFHELGLLYQNRNPDMLSLIKCAALFNAATARSPNHSRERIENDLKQLCFLILNEANAKNKKKQL